MAWTVSFQSVVEHPQTPFALQVTLAFTDGVRTITRVESTAAVDDPQFLRTVEGYKASLTKVAATIANPPAKDTPVPPPPVTAPATPTPEQQAQSAWQVLYRDWQLKAKELANNAGTTKQADVDAAQAAWKATYLPAYATLLQ